MKKILMFIILITYISNIFSASTGLDDAKLCPQGSELKGGKCIWQGKCPAGTISTGGGGCAQPNAPHTGDCIPGTTRFGPYCTTDLICPAGTQLDRAFGCYTIPTCAQGYELYANMCEKKK